MAIAAARELKVGRLINKTLDVLEKNWVVALIFIVGIAAINAGMAYVGLTRTAILQQLGLTAASIVIGVFVNFFLITTLLKRTGLMAEGEGGHLIPFLGLSVLHSLGVGLGFVLLIIPGLFVMARWSVAQPIFLSRGGGVMNALKQSWEQTRGNEFPIIVAGLALAIIFIAISIGAPFLVGAESILGLIVAQGAGAVMTVIFASFGVVLYGLLIVAREASTFE